MVSARWMIAWFATVVSSACAYMFAGPAHGQQPMLPMALGEAFQPDFYRRDLTVFSEVLELDVAQKPVLETLFADYESEFRAAAETARNEIDVLLPLATMDDEARRVREEQIQEKVRELMEQARQLSREGPAGAEGDAARKAMQDRAAKIRQELESLNNPPLEGDQLLQALAGSEAAMDRWRERKSAIRNAFVSDVQVVLTDEQMQRWPTLDRRLRRDKTLARGRLSGESVNIVQIVNELQWPPTARASVDPDLLTYEALLDVALTRRNADLESSTRAWFKVMQTRDRAQAAVLADEQVRLRVLVRNVNDDAARAIAAKLPAELATEFLETVQSRGYPQVFRSTQTQRILAAAQELPELPTEAAGSLRQLEQQYRAEVKVLNDQLVSAIRIADPIELKDRLIRLAVGGEEDPNPDVEALEKLFDIRTALGKRYNEMLEHVLTPDQWRKLPLGTGAAAE